MAELRRSTQAFVWTLVVLTLLAGIIGYIDTSFPPRRDAVLAGIFFGLQMLAVLFPLEVAPKQKLSLYTSVVFAAVLLFEPAIAMIIAGGGTLLAQAIRLQPSHQILFNTSQTALQAGLAGIVASRMNWDYQQIRFDRPSAVLVVLIAASIIYGVSAISVSLVVGLEAGESRRQIVRQVAAGSSMEEVSLFALGLLAVIVVDARVWALPLLLLLAVFVYLSSARLAVLRAHEQSLLSVAKENARLRDEFLMTASHELKTPITAIKAAAQLMSRRLNREGVQADPDRILTLNDQLLTQVERLQLLVGDLLDATQIHHGRLELQRQPVDLVDLTRRVVDRLDISTQSRGESAIVLDTPDEVEGCWDPLRLEHVVTNLLSNALKYSPTGGEIRLRIIDEGDWVQLDVIDKGIGIPAEEQDRLFSPFARGSNTGQIVDGSGLGLYIAHRIVQHHNGMMTISSVLGSGTTVTARIPRVSQDPDSVNLE